jgi:hypothetical protein
MQMINTRLKTILVVLTAFSCSCNGIAQQQTFSLETKLPKPLKEVSGIMAVNNSIWAISDKPSPLVFKLNSKGKLVQEVILKDVAVSDVEAITSDGTHLYIGDIGDNNGDRLERKIIKVQLSSIAQSTTAEVEGQVINFSFAGDEIVDRKKKNNYDCEAMLYFKDSLYLFTKRRADDYAALFVLPNVPGQHQARLISRFKTDGLITDAAINPSGNEVALVGYQDGHKKPFVLLFSNFSGNNFFNGTMKRYQFKGDKKDWQMEGITYKNDTYLYLSCEQTKEVPATLYGMEKRKL